MLVGKCVAGVVMGVIAAFLAALALGLVVPASPNVQRSIYAGIAIGFAVVFALSLGAARPRTAWGRGFLACGLLCVCLICATFVFAISPDPRPFVAASPMERSNEAFARTAVAGAIVMISGGIGVLGAAIFLTGAFLLFRRPR